MSQLEGFNFSNDTKRDTFISTFPVEGRLEPMNTWDNPLRVLNGRISTSPFEHAQGEHLQNIKRIIIPFLAIQLEK